MNWDNLYTVNLTVGSGGGGGTGTSANHNTGTWYTYQYNAADFSTREFRSLNEILKTQIKKKPVKENVPEEMLI